MATTKTFADKHFCNSLRLSNCSTPTLTGGLDVQFGPGAITQPDTHRNHPGITIGGVLVLKKGLDGLTSERDFIPLSDEWGTFVGIRLHHCAGLRFIAARLGGTIFRLFIAAVHGDFGLPRRSRHDRFLPDRRHRGKNHRSYHHAKCLYQIVHQSALSLVKTMLPRTSGKPSPNIRKNQ